MTQAGRSPFDEWIDLELAASERRTFLVDGFNLLHTTLLARARKSAWWSRDARDRLLERVSAWPDPSDAIWVAFDGSHPAWSMVALPFPRTDTGRPVRNVHSLFVESADDWIVRRARRASSLERTVVVSADRQVAGRARSAGCAVWTPWEFIAQCGAMAGCGALAESDQAPEPSAGAAPGDAPCGPRPSPNRVS